MTPARRAVWKRRLQRVGAAREHARRRADLMLWSRAYHALQRISARYRAETSREDA